MKLSAVILDQCMSWGGAGVVAFGLGLLLWALFFDRARGRTRCPKCWYDMAGLPGLVCPECGRDARVAKRLRKTRRKWRWAVVALLVALGGYVTMHVKELRQGEWVALVPTTAPIFVADPNGQPWLAYNWSSPLTPVVPSGPPQQQVYNVNGRNVTVFTATLPAPPAPTRKQLLNRGAWHRLTSGRMWEWQKQSWVERWIRVNGIKPEKWVVIPDRCAADESVPAWIDPKADFEMGCSGLTIVDQPRTWGENYYKAGCLPPVALGTTSIAVALDLEFGGSSGAYVRNVSIPVNVYAEDAMLEPVDSAKANELVRGVLDPRLVRGLDSVLVVTNERGRAHRWSPIDFGVGFRIRLEFDGRVVAEGSAEGAWGDGVPHLWKPAAVELEADRAAVLAAPERARIIIDGEPNACIRSYLRLPFGKRAAAWAGHIECPVRVEKEPEPDVPTP